jgi:hypothetical protein
VCAVPPLQRIDSGQAQVHLVHEGSRLQRVALALAAHVVMCETPQLFIHDRHELVSGGGIPVGPIGKNLGNALALGGVTIVGHRIGPAGF